MPQYQLECEKCDWGDEVLSQFENLLTECPDCGDTVRQVFGTSDLRWRAAGGLKTISFENKRKFTRYHKPVDARKRDYFM